MTQLSIQSSDERKKQRLNTLVQQALDRESNLLRSAIEKTRAQLTVFETKHALSSDEFFRRFQAGQTDDSDDFVDWSGEYQIYLSLLEQANALKDVVVCK
ncbi:MAG: hypothetical protein HY961_06140 [Ignavibacteriae bacterium]|nr:hypothetical protein [Ignavibacteriota bacterium]